jgi:hypothetical protein
LIDSFCSSLLWLLVIVEVMVGADTDSLLIV